jgi:DNA polymerase II large subunit
MALQSELQAKIRAVDTKDSIERVIASHFFPDIIGNARAFSRQTFRCTKCNLVYRRPPLKGTCKCGGNLILTIPEGGVKKYIEIAKKFIENYDLREYMKQRITLVEEEVNSLFAFTEEKKQLSLKKFL